MSVLASAQIPAMSDKLFHHGHAHKLEDPERRRWLPPAEVVAALELEAGHKVVDVGAGTGYFAVPMAGEIGAQGKVWAVDVQPEMLEHLRGKLTLPGAPSNVELVHGDAAATTLPDASADLVFLANVWHEVEDPQAVQREVRRLLGPGGRIAVLDWRPDAEQPPGPPLEHRVAADAVAALLADNSWHVQVSREIGRYSYLVIARRP